MFGPGLLPFGLFTSSLPCRDGIVMTGDGLLANWEKCPEDAAQNNQSDQNLLSNSQTIHRFNEV